MRTSKATPRIPPCSVLAPVRLSQSGSISLWLNIEGKLEVTRDRRGQSPERQGGGWRGGDGQEWRRDYTPGRSGGLLLQQGVCCQLTVAWQVSLCFLAKMILCQLLSRFERSFHLINIFRLLLFKLISMSRSTLWNITAHSLRSVRAKELMEGKSSNQLLISSFQ